MVEGYDATAKLVNEEIAKLGDAGTFADLAGIDKKLGLPKGTSFEMGDMLTTLRLRRIRPTNQNSQSNRRLQTPIGSLRIYRRPLPKLEGVW